MAEEANKIDLRKVFLSTIKKWYLWAVIPVGLMILLNLYYSLPQPTQYQLKSMMVVNYKQPELNSRESACRPGK